MQIMEIRLPNKVHLGTFRVSCLHKNLLFRWGLSLFKENSTESLIIAEPQHKISNNVVCATSKGSDQPAQSDQSLC